MKKNQGRRKGSSSSKGPRLPGALLKELGTSSGGGKGPGHRQTWKRTNDVKRRRGDVEDGNKPKKKRPSGRDSKFDELVPQSASAMDGLERKERKKKKTSVDVDDPEDPELMLQRKLAKKLGLKSTRLNDGQDGLDDLLREFDDVMAGEYSDASDSLDSKSEPSVSESDLSVSLEEESSDDNEGDGGHESVDVLTEETKYVPPALRKRTREDAQILNTTNEQEMAVRKRVRGLINRVAEANLEGIVLYVSCIIIIDSSYVCIFIWHYAVQRVE